MFARLREDIASVFDRDPAARSTWEVLTCYPGFHALLLHRLAQLALAGSAALAGALHVAFRALADRHRDPSGRDHRPPLVHRPRHGRGHRRDRRDRRRLHALSRRHPGRHLLEQGQAPSDPGAMAWSSARAPRCSDRSPWARARKIGSNAVVVKDVPAGATAVGIPARIIVDAQDKSREEKAAKLGFSAYARHGQGRGRSVGQGAAGPARPFAGAGPPPGALRPNWRRSSPNARTAWWPSASIRPAICGGSAKSDGTQPERCFDGTFARLVD